MLRYKASAYLQNEWYTNGLGKGVERDSWSERGHSPLHLAAFGGHLEVVQCLEPIPLLNT